MEDEWMSGSMHDQILYGGNTRTNGLMDELMDELITCVLCIKLQHHSAWVGPPS